MASASRVRSTSCFAGTGGADLAEHAHSCVHSSGQALGVAGLRRQCVGYWLLVKKRMRHGGQVAADLQSLQV